jgi:hypothetical protein
MPRKSITQSTEKEVLICSRRRCALCFGLSKDLAIKQGQIAHIDKDNSNAALENLVFLCFNHHNEYDSITSQSKGIAPFELKYYRDELYTYIQDASDFEDLSNEQPIRSGICRIQIKIDLADLGQRERNLLVHGLANFLDISEQAIEIVEVHKGSVYVTLDLPTESAGRLLVSDLSELSKSIELNILSLELKFYQEGVIYSATIRRLLHKLAELQKDYHRFSKAIPSSGSSKFRADKSFNDLIQSLDEANMFEQIEVTSILLEHHLGEAPSHKEVYQFSKNLREKLVEIHQVYCRTIDAIRLQSRKRKKQSKLHLNLAILEAIVGLKTLVSINHSTSLPSTASFVSATMLLMGGFNLVTGYELISSNG